MSVSLDSEILQALDWEPQDRKSDACESYERKCSNEAQWLSTMGSLCPHDGCSWRLCSGCRNIEVTKYALAFPNVLCDACYHNGQSVKITLTWKKLQ